MMASRSLWWKILSQLLFSRGEKHLWYPTEPCKMRSAVIDTTSAAVLEVLGTKVTVDTPLMSAGLDSIAVTDLVNVLSKRFEIELPPTLLFDHPTIGSVATHITTLLPMEISKESVVETREGTLTPAIARRHRWLIRLLRKIKYSFHRIECALRYQALVVMHLGSENSVFERGQLTLTGLSHV